MPINNFDFPGVSFSQSFAVAGTGTRATLGVACVGQQVKVHKAGTDTQRALEGPYVPGTGNDSGLKATILASTGATLDTSTAYQHLVVKNGLFAYKTLPTSGTISNTGKTITFSESIAAGSTTGFGTRGAKAGDPVILKDGSHTTETVIASVVNEHSIVVLDLGQITTPTSVTFCLYKDVTYEQSASTFTLSTDTNNNLTVSGSLTTPLSDLGGTTAINGELQDGEFYFEYRELENAFVHKLGIIESISDLTEQLGTPCKDNPLALACLFTFNAGGGQVVYFTGVSSETALAYSDALDFLEKYDGIYSIVPASENQSIIQQCAADCIRVSNDVESTIRRVLWYGITADADVETADLVEHLKQKRCTTSERAVCVWADGLIFNGEELPNYPLAAAAAGMRSYEEPQRPLSNLGYSFFSLADTNGLSKSQMKRIGANGIWIIANNIDGTPVNMRQITTAVANNLNLDEESIISNVDTIALDICQIGRQYVGNSNISPMLLDILEGELRVHMDSFLKNATSAYVGPQLLSWDLTNIYQDPVNLDHVYADFECEPPKPFNRFVMHMRVI